MGTSAKIPLLRPAWGIAAIALCATASGQSLSLVREVALNPLLGFPSHDENSIKIFRPYADTANGVAYAPPIFGGYVAKIDTATATLIDLVPTGIESREIKTVAADTDGLFLLHWEEGKLYAFDLATGTIQSELSGVAGQALTQSSNYLYYGENAGSGSRLHVIAKRRVLNPDAYDLVRVRSEALGITPLLTGVNEAAGYIRILGVPSGGSPCNWRVLTRTLDAGASTGLADASFTGVPTAYDRTQTHGHYAYDPATDESFLLATATHACSSLPSPRVLRIQHRKALVSETAIDFTGPGSPGCISASTFAGVFEMHLLNDHIVLLTLTPGTPNETLVGFFDRNTGCQTNLHALPGRNFSGAADPTLNRVVLSGMGRTIVTVIEPGGPPVVIDVGNTAEGALKHHTDNVYYVFNRLGGSQLVTYDADTDQASALDLPLWPKWGHVSAVPNVLYVMSYLGTMLTELSLATPNSPSIARQTSLGVVTNTTDQIGSLAVDRTRPVRRLFISHPERMEIVRAILGVGAPGITAFALPPPQCAVFGPYGMQLAYVDNPHNLLAVYCKGTDELLLLDPASMTYATSLPPGTRRVTVPAIPEEHYTNDIVFADRANDRVWVGPHFVGIGSSTVSSPTFRRFTGAGMEIVDVQRIVAYDATANLYIGAALGEDYDSFGVYGPGLPGFYFERAQLDIDVDRLVGLGVSFDRRSDQILVTVHNANKLLIIQYTP